MNQVIYDGKGTIGNQLAQALNTLGTRFTCTDSLDAVRKGVMEGSIDSLLFVTPDEETAERGNRLTKIAFETPFIFVTLPDMTRESRKTIEGNHCSAENLAEIVKMLGKFPKKEKKLVKDYGFAFEADPKGLTTVLMDQFSEPLLCFRELVQNSVDANSTKISINTSYDKNRKLLDVQVSDDGSGMTLSHIKTYLTLFDSTKDADIKKIGQMGAGKVFAHALKPELMTVETGNGSEGHKIIFNPDLSGKILETATVKGTNVRLLIQMNQKKAREFNKKLEKVVREWCKYVRTPLFINGEKINEPFELPGEYVERITEPGLEAVIGFGRKRYEFLKGGIMLEEDSYIHSERYENGNIMQLFGGMIDAEKFEFPISRNGIVRNDDFKNMVNSIKTAIIARYTPRFIEDLVNGSVSEMTAHSIRSFFHHILANGGYDVLKEEELKKIRELPIIKNIDSTCLSVDEVYQKIKEHGCLYYTSTGLSRTELNAFLEKGIPVLMAPENIVLEHLFGCARKQCLDNRYYTGNLSERIGRFNFSSINELLSKCFVSKVSASSVGGGFLGSSVNSEGKFDNPFDFSRIRVYGAEFKDLNGNPEEKMLLDSYWTGDYYRYRNVVFNVNHPFMKKMETLAAQNQQLAYFFIACELIKSKKVFENASYRIREHEMSRIGLKAVDNES